MLCSCCPRVREGNEALCHLLEAWNASSLDRAAPPLRPGRLLFYYSSISCNETVENKKIRQMKTSVVRAELLWFFFLSFIFNFFPEIQTPPNKSQNLGYWGAVVAQRALPWGSIFNNFLAMGGCYQISAGRLFFHPAGS